MKISGLKLIHRSDYKLSLIIRSDKGISVKAIDCFAEVFKSQRYKPV